LSFDAFGLDGRELIFGWSANSNKRGRSVSKISDAQVERSGLKAPELIAKELDTALRRTGLKPAD